MTVVPERSHTLLADLTAPADPGATTTPEQLAAVLRDALPAGLTVLTPSSAHDSEIVACPPAVIEELAAEQQRGDLADDDCRTVTATDPVIAREGLVPLVEDPVETPIEALTPLVRTSAATPGCRRRLTRSNSTLEPATLPALLAQVRFDGNEVSGVVKDWLETVDIT